MTEKIIECVLLVDDSASTNFFNKKLIEISGNTKEVYTVENGQQALDFILKKGKFINKNYARPNIIFLDINMPLMNGFEFLEEYAKLNFENKEQIMIVVVTTSNRKKDKDKMLGTTLIYDFIEKPLTKKNLERITEVYFQYYFNKQNTP